jgi:hypothetical protein
MINLLKKMFFSLLKKVYEIIGFHGLIMFTSLYSTVVYYVKYKKYKAVPLIYEGFTNHSVVIEDERHSAIIDRLIKAYAKAKEDQQKTVPPYVISQLWQMGLDKNFNELVAAIQIGDKVRIHKLLENLGRGFGFGGEYDSYEIENNCLYKYQFINSWYRSYEIYKEYAGDDSKLTYSPVGNPVGLYINGQTIPLDAIRFHYHAKQVFSLLRDINNPIICEIGAGLGGQAYKILSISARPMSYMIFDIPEVLVTASYFLMANFPEKKVLLYKEASMEQIRLEQYDIILMPYFILPQLGNDTVDLFFNAASFGEMESEMVSEYISQIERTCRKYFMHTNHTAKFMWSGKDIERKAHNSSSTMIVPTQQQFKKVYQYPEPLYLAREEDRMHLKYYYGAMYYSFLYEKITIKKDCNA